MRQQLQKRLTEEFVLRGTPLNTRLTYQRCIDRFERHFAASAATLGRAEVRQFLLHLALHEKLSPITHNVYAAALYFPLLERAPPPGASKSPPRVTLSVCKLPRSGFVQKNIMLTNIWPRSSVPRVPRFAGERQAGWRARTVRADYPRASSARAPPSASFPD
jgi:hypothetical protein